MKVKHILVILISSIGAFAMGSIFKILHFQGAGTLLLVALVLLVIGLVLAIWKIFTSSKSRDFLDS